MSYVRESDGFCREDLVVVITFVGQEDGESIERHTSISPNGGGTSKDTRLESDGWVATYRPTGVGVLTLQRPNSVLGLWVLKGKVEK